MNRRLQQTINKEIILEGVGLHTGAQVHMNIKPAEVDFGIRFKRTDLEGQPEVKALVNYVVDTSRGTTIEYGAARVSTIEHLMASLFGLGVDNALIELNAGEVPIMDGSAREFVAAIKAVGIKEQEAEKEFYDINEIITYKNEEKQSELVAMPADSYQVTTLIDFNSPVLGTQHAILKHLEDFDTQIAPCRTFCFLHELEYLVAHNLIKGGDMSNAIVVVDKKVNDEELAKLATLFNKDKVEVQSEGILNNVTLHFPNEAARHKLLDIIGDLALVGYSFNASIIATRPGHSSNVELAKLIREYIREQIKIKDIPVYDPNEPVVYETTDIEKILPHRFPFLLVDKIISLDKNKVVGLKNCTFTESHFQGHFPGNPIMPGVLQIESMAQVGGILALTQNEDPYNYDTYFMKIDKCKFKHKIVPGDTLIIKMELLNPIRRGICEMFGQVFVGDKLCSEALLVAQIIKTRND